MGLRTNIEANLDSELAHFRTVLVAYHVRVHTSNWGHLMGASWTGFSLFWVRFSADMCVIDWYYVLLLQVSYDWDEY